MPDSAAPVGRDEALAPLAPDLRERIRDTAARLGVVHENDALWPLVALIISGQESAATAMAAAVDFEKRLPKAVAVAGEVQKQQLEAAHRAGAAAIEASAARLLEDVSRVSVRLRAVSDSAAAQAEATARAAVERATADLIKQLASSVTVAREKRAWRDGVRAGGLAAAALAIALTAVAGAGWFAWSRRLPPGVSVQTTPGTGRVFVIDRTALRACGHDRVCVDASEAPRG